MELYKGADGKGMKKSDSKASSGKKADLKLVSSIKNENEPDKRVTDNEGITLTNLIGKHHKIQSRNSLDIVLKYLYKSSVWVPMTIEMSEKDQKRFKQAAKGETIEAKDKINMRPYITKDPNGKWFMPVFSEQAEVPQKMLEQYSVVKVPFLDCCRFANGYDECETIVVNPYTKGLLLSKNVIKMMVNSKLESAAPLNQSNITFENVTADADVVKQKATEFAAEHDTVKSMRAAVMTRKGEKVLIIIAELDKGADTRIVLGELNALLISVDYKLPIEFAVYPTFEKQLDEIGCEPFYIKK